MSPLTEETIHLNSAFFGITQVKGDKEKKYFVRRKSPSERVDTNRLAPGLRDFPVVKEGGNLRPTSPFPHLRGDERRFVI